MSLPARNTRSGLANRDLTQGTTTKTKPKVVKSNVPTNTKLVSPLGKKSPIPGKNKTAQNTTLDRKEEKKPEDTENENEKPKSNENNKSPETNGTTKQSNMDKYFDTNETLTDIEEMEEVEGDEDQSELIITNILEDEDIGNLKQQLLNLCDVPQLGKKKLPTERAFRAISYIKMLEQRTTRLPRNICREMDKALEIITNSILELQSTLIHAEAKIEIMETISPNLNNDIPTNEKTETRLSTGQPLKRGQTMREMRPRPPASFAEAVKSATTSIIIKATSDRHPEEVEQQIEGKTQKHHNKVKKIKRIHNGVKIECDSAEAAQDLKRTLLLDEEASAALEIKDAGLKYKRVMIFNVSKRIKDDEIINKVRRELGIDSQHYSEDLVKPLRSIDLKGGQRHAPLSLPEPLADRLLEIGSINLGLRECTVRNYVTITRCRCCLSFDHRSEQCRYTVSCSNCAGSHEAKNCPNTNRQCCALCREYNYQNRHQQLAPLYTDHNALASSCWVYKTLMKVRQIETDKGWKHTPGISIINGEVGTRTTNGVTRIVRISKWREAPRKHNNYRKN